MRKLLLAIQAILLIGIVVAFYSVYKDFVVFYNIEGTIFKIEDCIATHPILTPCFWGAFAFLGSFIWATFIYIKSSYRQIKYLFLFLIAATVFAQSNFIIEIIKFRNANGESYLGCSGAIVTNPFITPCFYGSLLFTLAFIFTFILKTKTKHLK